MLKAVAEGGFPVMLAYMSDGWSTELMKSRTVDVSDKTVQRTGKFRAEFLAEKSVLKSIDANGLSTCRFARAGLIHQIEDVPPLEACPRGPRP